MLNTSSQSSKQIRKNADAPKRKLAGIDRDMSLYTSIAAGLVRGPFASLNVNSFTGTVSRFLRSLRDFWLLHSHLQIDVSTFIDVLVSLCTWIPFRVLSVCSVRGFPDLHPFSLGYGYCTCISDSGARSIASSEFKYPGSRPGNHSCC